MEAKDKIDIDIFKVVTRAIPESTNLDIMANNLTQLLVGALEIKGCTIFVHNPELKEFEVLASFGLSAYYMNKGPVLSDKSIGSTLRGESVVIRDLNKTDMLQYPEYAREEGIGAIVALPIKNSGRMIGSLRLYHKEAWDVSERDLDSLLILAENIGLAMEYTKLMNTMRSIKEAIIEVHIV